MPLNIHSEELNSKSNFHSYLESWLQRQYLSAKQGVLLLAGLNPSHASDIDWQPSGYLLCRINFISCIELPEYQNSNYALSTRRQLEQIKERLDEEAANRREEVIAELSKAAGANSVPLDMIPSHDDCRDSELYKACKAFLNYYQRTEGLLDKFIKYWLDTGHDLNEEHIKASYFLWWAYNAGLSGDVPWWKGAVLKEIIQPIPKKPLKDHDNATMTELSLKGIIDTANDIKGIIEQVVPLAQKGAKFTNSQRSEGAFKDLMSRVYEVEIKIHGGELSCTQLWDKIPLGKDPGTGLTIQEKDESEQIIYWLHPKGQEKEMSIKTFRNHFSDVKRSYNENHRTEEFQVSLNQKRE